MSARAKIALITGITGQDGSYLAELLLEKGYVVQGLVRRTSNLQRSRIDHLRRSEETDKRRLFLHYGDLTDTTALRRIFAEAQPDEVYHLAGQSHVGLSSKSRRQPVRRWAWLPCVFWRSRAIKRIRRASIMRRAPRFLERQLRVPK